MNKPVLVILGILVLMVMLVAAFLRLPNKHDGPGTYMQPATPGQSAAPAPAKGSQTDVGANPGLRK